jgi:hypothetical protein
LEGISYPAQKFADIPLVQLLPNANRTYPVNGDVALSWNHPLFADEQMKFVGSETKSNQVASLELKLKSYSIYIELVTKV